MSFSRDAIANGYAALFDERTRTAHVVALACANVYSADRWPTVEIVGRVARRFGIAVDELGAFFGLIGQPGRRAVWVDVTRSPDLSELALEGMSDRQARAYGFMRMLMA